MSRKFLYRDEVEKILDSFKQMSLTNYPVRDYSMMLLAYRHGMRAAEVVNLKWSDIDINHQKIYVHRVKNSNPSWQSLGESEIKSLEELKCFYKDKFKDKFYSKEYIFLSSRTGNKMSMRSYQYIYENVKEKLNLPRLHSHMMRHSCGYELVNKNVPLRVIQDYLGHKQIHHTVAYTRLNPEKFNQVQTNVWFD
jgi:type 1 fimbriae regulatory protein FimB/type 1 fimbriae regulatory protein FimE